ncbi:hypothetical protein SUGI_0762670 [Cryptomeria japonica]|uniref:protein MID1-COMPLEMENTING ACTIVITY 1 n=1 Tax=Cryptomeria japonica TaxID=3369 RepID=UPI002414C3A9|nr:protein MID1-COMPLEMENTING ACTIVITY 1 [Cryptomeria japonica]XP_057862880.1 protein MID1-COMPLEMENTING ACTIVITY 1 [Cryptomeria japonica]XP_057862881.1 protein MID1-COMPLEMENTING ACTIVITY 1 [Cryptomeria japonica]GLJ37533.1 hypothetical protein SUGI_0762670 [Cryptomeria japonica]
MRVGIPWENMGDLANVAQLTGLDAVRLIALIVKAASNARMHKKNCRQFAQHLKLIGNLLEQLKITELKKYSETREPLEQLEDALRRSYVLVDSCQNRSYLYLLAMGWNIVFQFKTAQVEIDRYLKLIPLISLVDNYRVKERLQAIEKDQREYTLDEEEEQVHQAILNPESSIMNAGMLQKSLSRRYPDLGFEEALKRESEKLQVELRRSRCLNSDQCDVIQHLIEVTESVVNIPSEKKHLRHSSCEEDNHPCADCCEEQPCSMDGSYLQKQDGRQDSLVSSGRDLISERGSHRYGEWQTDLFGCCMEPSLCFRTCIYPCGTFSNIAAVASNGKISPEQACNDLMTYSLVFACCCYTCCIRRKLRKTLNIAGGMCDDFLTHITCCCCALVQEWREIECRGLDDSHKRKMSPPPSQEMES